MAKSGLSTWLEDRLKEGHLSLRGAALKTGLSHSTVRDILNGVSPGGDTIRKLAEAFSKDGHEKFALEDSLLILAGYRSQREGEETKQVLGRLLDAVAHFSEAQLGLVTHFAEFLNDMKDAEEEK